MYFAKAGYPVAIGGLNQNEIPENLRFSVNAKMLGHAISTNRTTASSWRAKSTAASRPHPTQIAPAVAGPAGVFYGMSTVEPMVRRASKSACARAHILQRVFLADVNFDRARFDHVEDFGGGLLEVLCRRVILVNEGRVR